MNRTLHAVYTEEHQILDVTRESRERGYEIIDVYAPYPVHGLESAMGLAPSRIPIACLIFAMLGAGLMFLFQLWTSAYDWPVNIGGKPLNSAPAFIPVTFETSILLAGLGTILVLFITSRLHPWKKPALQDSRLTDDHFLLAIRQTDADLHPALAKELLLAHGAIEVREVIEGETP